MLMDFGGTTLFLLLAGLLYWVFGPFLGLAVPQAKRALGLAALAFLLVPVGLFASMLFRAFPWGYQLSAILGGGLPFAVANCALAATVILVANVASDKQEKR